MRESGFLLGLGLGVILCLISHYWGRLQWLKLLRQFNLHAVRTPLPIRVQTLLSQQHQEQYRLQAEIDHWQTILTQAPMPYLEVDRDRLCLWCNPAAITLLGIQSQPGRPLIEMVRSYELDCLVEDVQTTATLAQREWLHSVLQPSGQTQRLPLRGIGLPLRDQRVGIFLENRLEVRRLRDERDRWASDVAHELKTPLTSLRLVAETLQDRVDPGLRSWVDRLLGETVRLSLLVQELLELNRLALAPAAEIERQPLDLVSLLRQAWDNLAPLAVSRGIVLDYHGPERCIYRGNEAQLFRLVLNLLDNALKYTLSNTKIRVELRSTPATIERTAGLELTITDGGPGFNPQDLPYIFERFFRSDTARSRTPVAVAMGQTIPDSNSTVPISSGSGLGLAIVQQIVECHQGIVIARNDLETGGAVVQVWLPQGVMPI